MTTHPIHARSKRSALVAATILAGSIASALAGAGSPPPPPAPTPADNPLSFAGGTLVFDFQERLRWEIRENNFDFNDATDVLTDDNWLLQRARIGMLWKPADWFKFYVQGQDSREIDSDRADFPGQLAAEGDDSFDLRQAFIEVGNTKAGLSLKVGRQLLSYGDERLIGAFDWNNIGRTFDAAKLRWQAATWSLDAFASSVVTPIRGELNKSDFLDGNENGRGQVFSGLYFSTSAISVQTTDIYALHLHEETGPRFQPAAIGDTNFFTLGLRMKSKPGAFAPEPAPLVTDGKSVADGKTPPPPAPAKKPVGLDYDAELAFQTGEVRGLDLTAFAVHAGLGYTFDTAWLPRLGVEYNYGTGDGDPTDGDVETFQNLFPTNHKFYGMMDVFSWQNIHNPAVTLKVQPSKTVTAQLDYHAFWLATTDDAWYRANGVATVRPLTPVARAASNYAGSEIDFVVTWNARKYLQFQVGYAHFFAGDYLADTGASDDADFAYVQATLTF